METSEYSEDDWPADLEDSLLDRRQASSYLESIGVRRKPATLAKLYCVRADGPPCVHDGRRVLYPKRLLHIWGVSQLTSVRRSSRAARAQTAAGPEAINS